MIWHQLPWTIAKLACTPQAATPENEQQSALRRVAAASASHLRTTIYKDCRTMIKDGVFWQRRAPLRRNLKALLLPQEHVNCCHSVCRCHASWKGPHGARSALACQLVDASGKGGGWQRHGGVRHCMACTNPCSSALSNAHCKLGLPCMAET